MKDNDYRKRVENAVDFIKIKTDSIPEIILELGTGLGDLAQLIENQTIIPYGEIPGFPVSSVPTHEGNLILGRLSGKNIAALQGRFHYYEGYSTKEITMPIRVLALLGAEVFIATNAAGGLNMSFEPGSFMVIRDHINFIPENPLRGPNIDEWGPRFPDLSEVYDKQLIDKTLDCALRVGISNIRTGVYVGIPGPSLETPAETKYLKNCGADAVGMSTIPEVIVAKHAGLKVCGISIIANVNDPDNFKPILLSDVVEQVKKVEADFHKLLLGIVGKV